MTKVDGRAARWAGQQERRRAEFVDAALAAIAEHGPDVSTEQIAERAGVARTRLYRHFDGAADLQRAIARRAAELVTAELAPLWHPEGSPNEMIAAAISTHLRWLTEHAQLHRYLVRTLPATPENFHILEQFAERPSSVVFLLPLLSNQRVELILFASGSTQRFTLDHVRQFQMLMEKASLAHQILLLKTRLKLLPEDSR